jgi:pyruvate dehydrogenase E2 component (dihydrolipoamide acetyltransferase)
MAEVVSMPRLSDTMEEGTVAKWHKKVGDKVSEGDLLAEIETDKATMDFEAFQEGTLLYIGTEEGNTAPVDSILAILGKEGEDISDLIGGGKSSSDSAKKEEKEEKEDKSEEDEKKKEETKEASAEKSDSKEEQESKSSEKSGDTDGRLKASPLAKKMAEDKGIDLSQVKGTGDGGRIVKEDIENFRPSTQSKSGSAQPAASGASYDEVNVSQMRKTIAKRLAESKFSAPHFYLTIDIDMKGAMEARKTINNLSENKVSFNDMVIKAAAVALKSHPAVNAAWMGDKIRMNHDINIGVAVAVEDGLMVPVVRHADQKGLSSINAVVKELAGQARNKKLAPADMEGGTFAISNLGMFGIEEFTAIINPPNSCILAVGAIRQEPVVEDGQIVVGNRMKVTLSCDHRTVDGATGAAFLQTFKGIMESPLKMLL